MKFVLSTIPLLYSITFVLLALCHTKVGACQTYHGGGTTILIAKDTQLSGYEYRIKAELEAVGYRVSMFDMDFREDTRRIMDIEANKHNAAAAIVCQHGSSSVEIWITDKVTNKTVIRHINIPEDEDADAFVALSTVELLRASLLEIQTPHELAGTTPPHEDINKRISPPSNTSQVRTKPGRASLFVLPTLFAQHFDGNPMLNMQLGFGYRFYKGLEFHFKGQIPFIPHRVEKKEGDILVRTGHVAAGLNWILVVPKNFASGDIGFGMAVLMHRISGQPTQGNFGREKSFFVPAPYFSFGIDLKAAQQLRIRLETRGGWCLSQLQLKIDNIERAVLGNFFLSVGLGIVFTI